MANRRILLRGATALAAGAIARPSLAQEIVAAYADAIRFPASRRGHNIDRLWDLDRRVYVHDRSSDNAQIYHVVGDIVHLSVEDWPSLARPDGGVLSGRTTLIVEARELILDMPLRFDDGGLLAFADTVRFGPHGIVSFAPPSNGHAQQLQLTAREITLVGARLIPFSFTLASPHREVGLSASSYRDHAGGRIASQDAAFLYLRSASLSRRDTTLENGTTEAPILRIDADGGAYRARLRDSIWPEASVLKVQRFFARSPYDEAVQDLVLEKIASLSQAFDAQGSGIAEMAAANVVQAIENRTNLFGLVRTAAPMTPLDARTVRFQADLDRLFGDDNAAGEIALWDGIAVAASQTGAVDPAAIADANASLDALTEELIRLNETAGEIDVVMTRIEDEIGLLNEEIRLQEEYVKQQIIADEWQNPNDGIVKGVALIATVGSIAFPAAAPFLAVASGIVSTINAVNRNEGDLLSMVQDVAGVVQNHVAIVEQARALRGSWNKARDKFDAAKKYVTDKGAMTEVEKRDFQEWKVSLQGMKSSGKALYELLAKNEPTAEIVFDEDRIRNDRRMVELVKARNAQVDAQTRAMERLAQALAQYDATSTEALNQAAILAEMQTLDLTNDRDNLRLRQIADIVRRDAISGLAREAILLRRAVEYVTGHEVNLPEDVLLFAEADAVEIATFVAQDAAQAEEVLRRRRAEQAASYRALHRRAEVMRRAAAEYEGWNISVPIPFTAHASVNTGDPGLAATKRAFIRGLNRLLADAIRSGRPSQSIPFPITASTFATSTQDAVLLGINVSRLTFTDGREPDAEFVLWVEHPRVGAMHRDGRVRYYSDAAVGVLPDDPEASRWPISIPSAVAADWKENLTQDVILGQINDFLGPFFAPYTIYVDATTPGDWSSIPEIESIAMEFVVAKPE